MQGPRPRVHPVTHGGDRRIENVCVSLELSPI